MGCMESIFPDETVADEQKRLRTAMLDFDEAGAKVNLTDVPDVDVERVEHRERIASYA
jgi:hypothetical protein